jgi:cytidyltransferase-like protein
MKSIWLIIWRFQPLHLGHQLLIETALEQHDHTLVLVWSANTHNASNPYSYSNREVMLSGQFPNPQLSIRPLPDFPSDQEWMSTILDLLPAGTEYITLYCWDAKNDSAVNSLLALKELLPCSLKIQEIPRSIIPVSATQVRKWIQEWNIIKLKRYIWEKTLLFLGL